MRWQGVPKVPGSIPFTTFLIRITHFYVQVAFRTYCLKDCGANGQSIIPTVSDAIILDRLWSTATGGWPLGYLGSFTASLIIVF